MRHPTRTPSHRSGLPTATYPGLLEQLYARHTSISEGRADGDSRLLHVAIIDRLAANQRIAEGEGWTSLALERIGGMGRLMLRGVPTGTDRREVVPDWGPRQPSAASPSASASARGGSASGEERQ